MTFTDNLSILMHDGFISLAEATSYDNMGLHITLKSVDPDQLASYEAC